MYQSNIIQKDNFVNFFKNIDKTRNCYQNVINQHISNNKELRKELFMSQKTQLTAPAKKRIQREPLENLRKQLATLDQTLLAILAKRAALSEQVEDWKTFEANGQKTIHPQAEQEKFSFLAEQAKKNGLNPAFIQSLYYLIISESCRIQIDRRQERTAEEIEIEAVFEKSDKESWFKMLRDNLLRLTERIAANYCRIYGPSSPFALVSYMDFEERVLRREIGTLHGLNNLGTAVDLGCATGSTVFKMTPEFQSVIGYDLSGSMIGEAEIIRRMTAQDTLKARFEQIDIEDGLPLKNGSISFAVMNLGTASDIRHLQRVIAGIKRILNKNGRFLLSFYNSSALFYHWPLPWPISSLLAEIDTHRHCLNIHFQGESFHVFARPYTVREVRNLLADAGLTESLVVSYPTIAAIMPNEIFNDANGQIKQSIKEIDIKLSEFEKGAYIIATGRKA